MVATKLSEVVGHTLDKHQLKDGKLRLERIEMLKLLLKDGYDVNKIPYTSVPSTYFHFACEVDEKIALIMLDYVDDINKKGKLGRTPLMIASAKNYKNLFKELLDNGADINIRDDEHKNAYNFASDNGNLEILKIILSR